MNPPTLYIFAGLPGSGKSTIAKELATRLRAVYLRIDTIEQAFRDLCHINVQGEGYELSYRVAADNLRLGNCVIADSCNPIALTRNEWQSVAEAQGAPYINIEITCSDPDEHRRRIEQREVEVGGLKLPSWDQVCNREYHSWSIDRIVIDTASRTIEECVDELFEHL